MLRKVTVMAIALLVATGVAAGAYMVGVNHGEKNGGTVTGGQQADSDGYDQPDVADEITVPAHFRTYENATMGFSFAYPYEWGAVSRTSNNSVVTVNGTRTETKTTSYGVGPLSLLAASEGTNTLDADTPLARLSKGYEKEGDVFHSRFMRQMGSSSSDLQRNMGGDYFEELQVNNETIVVFGNNCQDKASCGLFAVMNLKNDDYRGLGVRYDQPSSEDFDEAKNRFKTILRTFTIEQ